MDTSSLLMQICMARLRGSGGPDASQLIAGLNGAGSPGHGGLEDIIRELGDEHPAARLIAANLGLDTSLIEPSVDVSPQHEHRPVIDTAAYVKEPDDPHDRSIAPQALQELRTQVEALMTEVQRLRAHNERLAWALGACPLCWGDDAGCASCGGRGRPGFSMPDRQTFMTHVLPAARMWRMQQLAEQHLFVRKPSRRNGSHDMHPHATPKGDDHGQL